MRSAIISAIVAMSALGSTSTIAREPTPITKREARTLPAPQVERRVMAQLSDIIEEERWEGRKPPVRPLTDMSFATKPRSTRVPGLCRVDRLRVSFRPAEQGDGDADTPVIANGLSASHYFYFREVPKSHYHDVVDYDRNPDQSACNEVSLAKNHFFNAEGEESATNGFFLAQKVMNEILGGKPEFPVDCDRSPNEKYRTCADIVREMKENPIDLIDSCESHDPPFSPCYKIYAGDRAMWIIASPIASGPNVLPPFTPLKVKVDELIIMAHERVD